MVILLVDMVLKLTCRHKAFIMCMCVNVYNPYLIWKEMEEPDDDVFGCLNEDEPYRMILMRLYKEVIWFFVWEVPDST